MPQIFNEFGTVIYKDVDDTRHIIGKAVKDCVSKLIKEGLDPRDLRAIEQFFCAEVGFACAHYSLELSLKLLKKQQGTK